MRIVRHPVAALMLMLIVMGGARCASMPPVHLEATPADLELLAGQWEGEYSSPALGRRGSIEFKLIAGQNEATGAVLMIPKGSGRPYQLGPNAFPPDGVAGQPPSQLLTIRFVRASAGTISGMLDPYWDPDRNCGARTVFDGKLVERTIDEPNFDEPIIDGTFRTTFDCGAGQASGRWRVTRKSAQKEDRHGR